MTTSRTTSYDEPTLDHLIEMSVPWWQRALPPPVYIRLKFERHGTTEADERIKWGTRVYGYGD